MMMIKNNVDAITALKIAIQTEINSYKLYLEAYSSVKNENSRDILRLLADEELSHKRRLEKLYTHLSGRKIMALNLKPKMNFREIENEYISPLEVLEIAIDNEKENLKFYRDAAEKTVNYDGKKMFFMLIKEEESHLELLEMEYKVRQKNFPEDNDEVLDNMEKVSEVMN